MTPGTVARVQPRDGRQAVLGAGGQLLCMADIVCIASGHASAAFAPDLTLQPVRGQASWTGAFEAVQAVSKGGYSVPTADGGVLFGATFARDVTDDTLSEADHDRNRALLAEALPGLAARIAAQPLSGRAGIRAATRDRLPLAGALPGSPGQFILSGLGSRGFCVAPLLAEHVAALAMDAPSPLPADLAAEVAPGRFAARALRRGSP